MKIKNIIITIFIFKNIIQIINLDLTISTVCVKLMSQSPKD